MKMCNWWRLSVDMNGTFPCRAENGNVTPEAHNFAECTSTINGFSLTLSTQVVAPPPPASRRRLCQVIPTWDSAAAGASVSKSSYSCLLQGNMCVAKLGETQILETLDCKTVRSKEMNPRSINSAAGESVEQQCDPSHTYNSKAISVQVAGHAYRPSVNLSSTLRRGL